MGTTLLAAQGKTNFFEKRVGEYQKSGVMSSSSMKPKQQHIFSTQEDF